MENEIAELKLQLAHARDALYFAKRDHKRELAELQALWANDQAHIADCHTLIIELKGDK